MFLRYLLRVLVRSCLSAGPLANISFHRSCSGTAHVELGAERWRLCNISGFCVAATYSWSRIFGWRTRCCVPISRRFSDREVLSRGFSLTDVEGFTIGRVLNMCASKCLAGAPHNIPAWRVLTEEADDESEVPYPSFIIIIIIALSFFFSLQGKSKLVPTGLLGRLLCPWASKMRLLLEKEGVPKKTQR